MMNKKFMGLSGILFLFSGCTTVDCLVQEEKALAGTNTAIVGLYIDDKGFPQTKVETINLYPGQRVVFAGPDSFDILFKDDKPIGDKLSVSSENGLVIINVPRDIFEREKRLNNQKEQGDVLRYRYGIRVKDKITDPNINIIRR